MRLLLTGGGPQSIHGSWPLCCPIGDVELEVCCNWMSIHWNVTQFNPDATNELQMKYDCYGENVTFNFIVW